MSSQATGVIEIRTDSDSSAGILKSAGAGMAVGGLMGFGCGLAFALCVPVGAVAGAITGTVEAVGTGPLSEDEATRLRARLMRVQQARPLLANLQSNISDRARNYWNLSSEQPTSVVTVELQDLLLLSRGAGRVRSVVRVQVAVQSGGAATTAKLYEYVGPWLTLKEWLDEDSIFVATSLTTANEQIAAELVSDLAQSSEPKCLAIDWRATSSHRAPSTLCPAGNTQ
jgi:hypothetical protein